jgi:hypothetical protein
MSPEDTLEQLTQRGDTALYEAKHARQPAMSAATLQERPRSSPRTVRVHLNRHGAWEITLPLQLDPINCESLYEARRAAYRFAAHWRPCEVVLCDAYHRVMHPAVHRQLRRCSRIPRTLLPSRSPAVLLMTVTPTQEAEKVPKFAMLAPIARRR